MEGNVRHSLRLKDFDYTTPATYFVTLCVQNRACVLGEIADGIVRTSIVGAVVESWWCSVGRYFPMVEADAYVVMPNHLHGVLRIDASNLIGKRSPVSLGRIVQWFKSSTTLDYTVGVHQYGWTRFPGRLWQRNYYDHIVRDEAELDRVREYIFSNPGRWTEDAEYLPICHGF